MAVTIRLVRKGRNNRPFYRIVAVDRRKDGRGDVLEVLGSYDPLPNPAKVELKDERVAYWLSVGAQPSGTVASILRKRGIDAQSLPK